MDWRISALALLFVVWSGVDALTVTIPDPVYEHARGDNITLPCSFKSTQPNPPQVIISWSVEGTAANAEELLILTHYHPSKITDIKKIYEGRVSADVDVPTGKANLNLKSITLADNKNFECRVQIPKDDEGKPADTTRLVVLVAPSKPICKIQGTAEYGQNINLTCYSEEGSPTPTYKWDSFDVQSRGRPLQPRATDQKGILSLYNISRETSGFYICTSTNKIRSATCNITVSVMPPSMNIGSTAGIIGGVIAFLIILAIIIFCCCCRKKNKEEEYAMTKRDAEYYEDNPDRNDENHRADGQESTQDNGDPKVTIRDPSEQPDNYADRSERYDDRRSDYDDRRSDYNDRRSEYDDRRSDYNDRRSEYDDRRSDYDDRRSDYNDRRSDYDDRRNDYNDRRSDYDDRRERYDDDRNYDDRRDRR